VSGAPLHAEVLTAVGLAAARTHARASDELGFHLARGTALALQLGHRKSVDFDGFRIGERFDPLVLAAGLEERGARVEVRSMEPGTLHGLVFGVRVSWLAYPYPLLAPTCAGRRRDARWPRRSTSRP
jgi:hypothetical protein